MKYKILALLLILVTLLTFSFSLAGCSKLKENDKVKTEFKVDNTELYFVKVEFKRDIQTSIYKSIAVYENGVVIFVDREDKESRGKITDEDISMIKDIIQRDKYKDLWVKISDEIDMNNTYVYKLEAEVEYVNTSEELIQIIKSLVISAVQKNSSAIA